MVQIAAEDRAAFADLVDAPRPDRLRAAHRASRSPRRSSACCDEREVPGRMALAGIVRRLVVGHARDAAAARQPRMRRRGARRARATSMRPAWRRSCFDPADDIAAPYIDDRRAAAGGDPARAGRQQPGRNGGGVRPRRLHAVDVHMSDLIAGRVRLDDFTGFAACGGFSYGDVLGAGRGWATSILERTGTARAVRRILRARATASASASATVARCWRSSRA